jgi:hypothetical protein
VQLCVVRARGIHQYLGFAQISSMTMIHQVFGSDLRGSVVQSIRQFQSHGSIQHQRAKRRPVILKRCSKTVLFYSTVQLGMPVLTAAKQQTYHFAALEARPPGHVAGHETRIAVIQKVRRATLPAEWGRKQASPRCKRPLKMGVVKQVVPV